MIESAGNEIYGGIGIGHAVVHSIGISEDEVHYFIPPWIRFT